MGHVVTAVATCVEAGATLDRFDVAVLDVELPDGTGIDVGRELLTRGLVGAVVFCSGQEHANVHDVGRLVLKPDFEELREAIDSALSGR
jgi:DNA-binding NarL/FixJ family response regulator